MFKGKNKDTTMTSLLVSSILIYFTKSLKELWKMLSWPSLVFIVELYGIYKRTVKIDPNVVICLNRNWKQEFNLIFLRNKQGLILKFGQLIKYHIMKIFIKKYAENGYLYHVANLYQILVICPNYSKCIQDTLP